MATKEKRRTKALHPAGPAELLRKAIDATPDPQDPAKTIPDSRFATDVLDVNDRTVRRYLARERPIPGPVLKICRRILGLEA